MLAVGKISVYLAIHPGVNSLGKPRDASEEPMARFPGGSAHLETRVKKKRKRDGKKKGQKKKEKKEKEKENKKERNSGKMNG